MTVPEQFVIRDRRRQGWFSLDNEIIDDYGRHIGAYGVAVYCVISRHSRNEVARLSQREIAASLGISQDRVRKSLAALVELCLLHVDIPERAGPGLISTITLGNVKPTERHTFSSMAEPKVTRSRNKEVKTKTETETASPLFRESAFSLEENERAREACAKNLCDRRAFPATHSNVAAVAAAIKGVEKQNSMSLEEAGAWLEGCVRFVQSQNYPDLRIDRFFFEDAKYNLISPLNWSLSQAIHEPQEEPPASIVGKCRGCGRPRLTTSSWSDYCADSCRLDHERRRELPQNAWPEEKTA